MELDPFLFDAIGSADPAHYIEFCEAYTQRFSNKSLSPEKGLEFAREYSAKLSDLFREMYPTDATIADLFAKHITSEIWLDLWDKAATVASKRLEAFRN